MGAVGTKRARTHFFASFPPPWGRWQRDEAHWLVLLDFEKALMNR